MTLTHARPIRRLAGAWAATVLLVASALVACTAAPESPPSSANGSAISTSATPVPSASSTPTNAREKTTMIVSVNGHDLELQLADNSSAHAFADLVGNSGLELAMEDYGGFEKVGPLPQRLPTNDEQITTRPGDVILYQGDKLAIYYDTNAWTFTRIGRIIDVDADRMRKMLGEGDVTVTITASE